MADERTSDAAKDNDPVIFADSCGTCFYGRSFERTVAKHVECRRFPDPRDKSASYWCGEFKARAV